MKNIQTILAYSIAIALVASAIIFTPQLFIGLLVGWFLCENKVQVKKHLEKVSKMLDEKCEDK